MDIVDDLLIRPYAPGDEAGVIALWIACGLVRPWNNPKRDIERKLQVHPEWFLVSTLNDEIVATCMAGYEGHRGWINYLAVSPRHRRQGIGSRMMAEAEHRLIGAGCPKVNLQVRESNTEVLAFYRSIGYSDDHVVSLGKRLEADSPYDTNAGIMADLGNADT
jgi:ribosomal protein S18 acetylase RimI-like enzyme